MKAASIKDDLFVEIDKLPHDLQVRVLQFAKSLTPKGVKGDSLLRFEGELTPEDLQSIAAAIEEGCETVDRHEW